VIKELKIQKRAQHEIVGFVVIVLMVTIVGLIFLSFSINKEPRRQNSVEISKLLGASMYYTTNCSTTFIPDYKNGQDLIKECYKNSANKCLNGESVCSVLETDLENIIDNGLQVHPDSPNKAYKLNIYHRSLESENIADEEILKFEKGLFSNCTSQVGASHSIDVSGLSVGIINVELLVCRND